MNKYVRLARLSGEYAISGFKYLIALFMILSGVLTAITPVEPASGALGVLYSSRLILVALGAIFAYCGGMLLYGKIRKSRKWTGRGLMAIYLCFVFAVLIQLSAYGFGDPSQWVGNLIASIIIGALWLRWKFKTEYIKTNHFRDDIRHLRE